MARPKENQNVINILIAVMAVLVIVAVVSQKADFTSPAFIYFVLAIFAIVIYLINAYQSSLVGISKKHLGLSIGFGVLLGGVFYVAAKIFPSFSIIAPILPASISSELRVFIILFLAPIVETIAVQGAVMGYLFSVTKNKYVAIIGQALVFALLHLGAYISAFFDLPTFTAGLNAFTANLSGFLAAFVFALVAGSITINKGVKNLVFAMVLHFILNLILYTTFAVVFAFSMGLIGG